MEKRIEGDAVPPGFAQMFMNALAEIYGERLGVNLTIRLIPKDEFDPTKPEFQEINEEGHIRFFRNAIVK